MTVVYNAVTPAMRVPAVQVLTVVSVNSAIRYSQLRWRYMCLAGSLCSSVCQSVTAYEQHISESCALLLLLRSHSIGYPSESVSSSKWYVWFASRCPDRRLSTWQMTATSCPTSLGALCGQLTFRLAWCREHSAVTVQPLDLACGTLFRSSCAIQTSSTDCSDDS